MVETTFLSVLGSLGVLVLMTTIRPYAFIRLFAPFEPISQSEVLIAALAVALAFPLLPDRLLAFESGTAVLSWHTVFEELEEVFTGSSIAILASIPIKIIYAIGQIIDNQQGISINGPQNPISRDTPTPFAMIATLATTTIVFHFGWHLDILEIFFFSYRGASEADFLSVGQAVSRRWIDSLGVFQPLLMGALPLIALLLAIDIANAVAVRRLQSSDLGGLVNAMKMGTVAVWLVLAFQGLLSPDELALLHRAFVFLADPSARLPG